MTAAPAAPRLGRAFPEAAELIDLLRRRGLRLAVAESCTGGLLGAALTAVPGSSGALVGGVIAYDDAVKRSCLDVDAALLAGEGAVSAVVAEAMARGVRRALGVDLGCGVTGIAGPGADGTDKPVGLIFVSVAGPAPGDLRTVRLTGDRGREANRAAAVRAALRLAAEAAGAPETEP